MVKVVFRKSAHYSLEVLDSFFPQPKLLLNDTSSPIIKWGVVNDSSVSVGILKILSFIDDEATVVQVVGDLLRYQLNQTSLVLIDIRDNPGGNLLLSESLVQLFSASLVDPTLFRALISPINEVIFLNATPSSDPWHQAYQNIPKDSNSSFTPLVSFSSKSHINSVGQAYRNPITLLTNAHCYSACDMFAASMKENAKAFIIGEDSSTGGGGANVISWTGLNKKYPVAFPRFPYFGKGYIAQSASVAWRQSLRRNGDLIEDVGVMSDIMLRLSLDELLNGDDLIMKAIHEFILHAL